MCFNKILLLSIFFAIVSILEAQEIKVDPGTCIKTESGTNIDISGGGNLILGSDASGNASLLDMGSISYTGGSEANVERYITNGKWHLISSPVADAVSGLFEDDFLQSHDESTNLWSDITIVNQVLNPAQGYGLWSVGENPSTEVFNGETNSGDQSYYFTENNEGFNLIGNPYPSVLDWDAVDIPWQLNGAIWLFDPTVGDNGYYLYYLSNAGAANTTTNLISSGQGFFVRSTGGNGELTFKNSDRVHGSQVFYKEKQMNQMLVLKASGNDITTQTAIRFIPESSVHVDRLYDVNKIISYSTDVPIVYTECDGEKMAINSLPSVDGHEKIAILFEVGMDGEYAFKATEIESLDPNVPVYLEDVSANYIQDLRANSEYSFTYSTGAVKDFNIYFKDVTGIGELDSDENQFNCVIRNGVLTVDYQGQNTFDGDMLIDIYSLSGQHIQQVESSNEQSVINLASATAMYLVTIQYQAKTYSTKVFNQ